MKALIHNTQGNAKPMPDRRGLDPGPHLPEDTIKAVGPKVGPVLIVTFTNHALDQFLEGLLAAGLTDMVRVGGRYN